MRFLFKSAARAYMVQIAIDVVLEHMPWIIWETHRSTQVVTDETQAPRDPDYQRRHR